MFCIKCGQQLPNDARFCSQCGAAIVNHPQSSIDLVAAKAEDISVADEIVVSNIHVLNDEVAQKAEMLGIPTEIVSEPTPVKVKKTVARKRYEYQRKNLDIPDLWVIRRIDKDTGSITASCVEYQGKKSDWLDQIWYDDINFTTYPVLLFKHKGRQGLMQIDLTCQYWDEIKGTGWTLPFYGYLFVRKGRHWAIITIKNKKIEQLTDYEFDDIRVLHKDDALIIERNKLYGYMTYNPHWKRLYKIIPCVLDQANAFEDVVGLGHAAKVFYHGEEYYLKEADMNLWQNKYSAFRTAIVVFIIGAVLGVVSYLVNGWADIHFIKECILGLLLAGLLLIAFPLDLHKWQVVHDIKLTPISKHLL